MLEAEQLAAALTVPRLISDYSAWVTHIPFAFTLMSLLRPRLVVELGTHKGDSYCAFCQAADTRKRITRCVAVDTWTGDAHAGYYDAAVLQTLRAHHDPLYAGFSTLQQSTFDHAAESFPPASIDLLHIDGSHDYAAVRHDFATWHPRLSAAAVVLLHDTQVVTEGFGVHRFWQEVRQDFPHFEFHHGYGLGILAVGKNPPASFLRFLQAAADAPDLPRSLFAALGQRLDFSRTLGLLAAQLKSQQTTANCWRTHVGAAQLPPFEATGAGRQALAPPTGDPKAWLDQLGWFSANITGDFAHCLAAATRLPQARQP